MKAAENRIVTIVSKICCFHQKSENIEAKMREVIYSIKHPEQMLFDLDSTLLITYGSQEGEGFNYHYIVFKLCSSCPN